MLKTTYFKTWNFLPDHQVSPECRYPQFSGLPGVHNYHDQIKHPRTISTADAKKIKGQSLNGRKLILKPVKSETNARTIRTPTELK